MLNNYHKSELTNGLRVVTHDLKDRASASVGIWVGTGGRYEADPIKGAAHFLEHILFKGSKNYSGEEIKGGIEGVGGSLNAFTSEEQTCYYAKVPAQQLNKTLDILMDMVMHPAIKPKDVNRERTVILEEIKMYRDLPQYYVMDLLDGLMWPGHPLGKNIAGTNESVGHLDSAALKEFHSRYYSATNMVVAASGRVDSHSFLSAVKKAAGKLFKGEKTGFLAAPEIPKGTQLKTSPREIEQMHLAFGLSAFHDDHKDRYILNMIHVLLGGNMSSRLFNEVREKRGLAYSISTSTKMLHDTGIFLIRAGVDNNKMVEAVDVILKELKKLRRTTVPATEFRRAKDYYKGQILLALEDTMDHMLWLGESVLSRNRIKDVEEILKKVSKITPADVRRVANAVLDAQHLKLAVVGPITEAQNKELGRLLGV